MLRRWTSLLAIGMLGCDPKGDGTELIDNDGDGALAEVDCDDNDASVFPGADELCDSIDNDCDDSVDEDVVDGNPFYIDADGDGYGSGQVVMRCTATEGFVENADDCDDASAYAYPGGIELCDGHDNDCNGDIDGDALDQRTWYPDLDGDGFGNGASGRDSCQPPASFVDNGEDCDDSRASLNPDTRWYPDGDGDGYGSPIGFAVGCAQPKGYVDNLSDCLDDDPEVYPGQVLEDPKLCLIDLDRDGYGDANPPVGIDAGTDCDDSSARTYPGASTEDPSKCMADEDFDGYGDASPPVGVEAGTDCDDSNDATYPGAVSEDPSKCMADSDSDGYGDANPPAGVDPGSDCDDDDASQYPGATEYCNNEDDDCNGQRDDNPVDATSYYADDDGDGYGDSSSIRLGCFQPTFTSVTGGDCDDTSASVYPAAPEDCTDGIDNNCNSETDEVCTYSSADADVVISGATTTYDYIGQTVASGDVTGDGYDDIIIGAYGNDVGASSAGQAYVFAGPVSSGDALNVKSDATITITGTSSSEYLGSRAAAGDLDGDGYDDLILAGYYYNSGRGEVVVYYGPVSATSLTSASPDARIQGVNTYDYLGYYLLKTVDMDSDGKMEVLSGAYSYDPTGASSGGFIGGYEAPSGSISMVSGATYGVSGNTSSDYLGYSGAVADFNGDGDMDLVYGAPYYREQAYIINGPVTSASLIRTDYDVAISHRTTYDYTGAMLVSGDFNGDGADDLIVTSYYDDIGNTFTGGSNYSMGAMYLFYGPITTNMTDSTGYDALLYETVSYNYFGGPFYSDIQAYDLDADGTDELLISSSYDDLGGTNAGSVYIYEGNLSGAIQLGADYYTAIAAPADYHYMGRQVATGDVDGDGLDDVLAGSYGASSYYGEAYVFFGSNF